MSWPIYRLRAIRKALDQTPTTWPAFHVNAELNRLGSVCVGGVLTRYEIAQDEDGGYKLVGSRNALYAQVGMTPRALSPACANYN